MKTFHGCLGSSLLQGINNLLFEETPVVEGFNPEKVNQREELLDLVLAVAEVSNVGTPSPMRDLHGSAGKTPTMVALERKAGLRAFC